MNITPEVILGIINLVSSVILPYFFENNLWSDELPKTLELFNKEYEDKINSILYNSSNKSSEFLEDIIKNKIELKDESDSFKYSKLLKMHDKLLIQIRLHIEIEEMHKSIENLYHELSNTIKNIKNIAGIVVVFYLICVVLFVTNYFHMFQIFITCGIFCLTFYSIFRCGELYFKFKSDFNKVLDYKKWILDNYKNIPRVTDDV